MKTQIYFITFYDTVIKDHVTFEEKGVTAEDAAASLSERLDKDLGKKWRTKYQWESTQPKVEPQPLSFAEFNEFTGLKLILFKGHSLVVFTDEELASDNYKRYDELLRRIFYCVLMNVPTFGAAAANTFMYLRPKRNELSELEYFKGFFNSSLIKSE